VGSPSGGSASSLWGGVEVHTHVSCHPLGFGGMPRRAANALAAMATSAWVRVHATRRGRLAADDDVSPVPRFPHFWLTHCIPECVCACAYL
jgi:hypothetical protein